MKTSELTGAALDWAVAKCVDDGLADFTAAGWRFKPSTDWAHGGPIIEREMIFLGYTFDGSPRLAPMAFRARRLDSSGDCMRRGDTPLIAAMRCYVASRLGEEIEIPDELKEN